MTGRGGREAERWREWEREGSSLAASSSVCGEGQAWGEGRVEREMGVGCSLFG